MQLLCLTATYIRSKHKTVWSVSTKFLLVHESREKLDVTTTTFNVLLKPYRILEDQCSVLVVEFRYLCRYGKKPGISSCLNTFVIWISRPPPTRVILRLLNTFFLTDSTSTSSLSPPFSLSALLWMKTSSTTLESSTSFFYSLTLSRDKCGGFQAQCFHWISIGYMYQNPGCGIPEHNLL